MSRLENIAQIFLAGIAVLYRLFGGFIELIECQGGYLKKVYSFWKWNKDSLQLNPFLEYSDEISPIVYKGNRSVLKKSFIVKICSFPFLLMRPFLSKRLRLDKTEYRQKVFSFFYALINRAIPRYLKHPVHVRNNLGYECLAFSPELQMFPVEAELELITQSPLLKLENPVLYNSNTEAFAKILELVRESKKTLCLCFWEVSNDRSGAELIKSLEKKVSEGVKVFLAIDQFFVQTQVVVSNKYKKFLDRIIKGGIELVLIAYKPSYVSSHRKLIIADEAKAFISDGNIGDQYCLDSEGASIDFSISFENDAARQLQILFYRIINHQEGINKMDPSYASIPSEKEDGIVIVDHHANFEGVDPIFFGLLRLIASAKHSVDLCFAYITAPYALRKVLRDAKRRGVKIRILTNSLKSTDERFIEAVRPLTLNPLIESQVPVYLMKDKMLHAKYCVVDDQWSMLGSHNIWPLSSFHDSETDVFIRSQQIAEGLKDNFNKMIVLAEKQEMPISCHSNIIDQLACYITFSSVRERVHKKIEESSKDQV